MENHSAEYYRGAYHIASRYAPMDVAMQINAELAQAEAREAAPDAAAVIAQAKAALESSVKWIGRIGHYPGADKEMEDARGKAHESLSAIAALEASNAK